ncbi:hypothetical protein [Clostridium sardiniense]|uniref:hypothetical protein n=1 Tax=Clostridium sardiniense TaxID=29369 RepID=UPI003D33DB7C
MNKILKNTIIFILSISITFLIFYLCLDNIFARLRIVTSDVSLLALKIFIGSIIYLFICIIINKKVTKFELNMFFISYFLLLIMVIFKEDHLYVRQVMSLGDGNSPGIGHLVSIITIIGGNLIAYIPIGIAMKLNFKNITNVWLIIIFFIYILVINYINYISRLDIFYINNVILNFVGFYIGLISFNLHNKKKLNK